MADIGALYIKIEVRGYRVAMWKMRVIGLVAWVLRVPVRITS